MSAGGGPVGGGGGGSSGQTQTFTEREYVWAPPPSGYVDECVCQIDRSNAVRYVIQDASYDVVAIVAPQTQSVPSKVIGQYTWDPYGQVLTAEYAGLAASYNKLGHHGLFADRLDANYTQPTLAAGFLSTTHLPARIFYQVRNRTYDPSTQRWLQRDPNATGQVVLGKAGHRGGWYLEQPAQCIDDLYADGMNLYATLRREPVSSRDPLGLSATEAAIDFSIPGPSDYIQGMLNSMVTEYAANLDWDSSWAGDWTTGDDWHSRLDNTWVTVAMLRGVYDAFEIDIPFTDIGFNPLDGFADTASPPRTSKSSVKVGRRLAHFTASIDVAGYRATKYKNPHGGRAYVLFDPQAVRATVRIEPSANRATDADRAYKAAGIKDRDSDWVWHHHSWKRGIMELVPRELHRKAGHLGWFSTGGQ